MSRLSIVILLAAVALLLFKENNYGDVVSKGEIYPRMVEQGEEEDIEVSYRISAKGATDFSATALAFPGSIDRIPPQKPGEMLDDLKGVIRTEPKYQIFKEDIKTGSMDVKGTFPAPYIQALPVGVYSVFVVTMGSDEYRGTTKIGEFRVGKGPEEAIISPLPIRTKKTTKGSIGILNSKFGIDANLLSSFARNAGYGATILSIENMADLRVMKPEHLDILVLTSTIERFPEQTFDTLRRYLKEGGDLIVLGKKPEPLIEYKGKIGTPESFVEKKVIPVEDFEKALPGWSNFSSPKDKIEVSQESPGANKTKSCARIRVGLSGYAYMGLKLEPTENENYVLCFWAKGDEKTKELCIETNEKDGSRWKWMVELETDWKLYRIHPYRFLSYATKERGGEGNHFSPQRVKILQFGFTVGMAGKGEHIFWLDEICWQEIPQLEGIEEVLPFHPAIDRVVVAFGKDNIRVSSPQEQELKNIAEKIGIFSSSRHFTGMTNLSGLNNWKGLKEFTGKFSGWTTVPDYEGIFSRDNVIASLPGAKMVPLLNTYSKDSSFPAVTLIANYSGPFKGSRWIVHGIDNSILLENKGLLESIFISSIDTLKKEIFWNPEMLFIPEGESVCLNPRITFIGKSREPVSVEVKVTCGEKTINATRKVDLIKDKIAVVDVKGPLVTKFLPYQVDLIVKYEGKEEKETISCDPLPALRSLADWLVSMQTEEGKFCGISFIDNRAARGLLGAYEILKEEKYKEAALKWADMIVAKQFEHGGYRMGYGEEKGECYVADGGEIAAGVIRCYCYADGKRKESYLNSFKRYLDYKENFRNPDGSIGVGWVTFDYGGTEKKLDELTRNMATNQYYTVGLSVLDVVAMYKITGEKQYRDMTIKDAKFVLEKYKTHGSGSAEALMWVHNYIDDNDLKEQIAGDIKKSFLERAKDKSMWWLQGGGRNTITLNCMDYFYREIEKDPSLLATIYRAINTMVLSDSPFNLLKAASFIKKSGKETHNHHIYFHRSLLFMCDLVKPGVTLLPIK